MTTIYKQIRKKIYNQNSILNIIQFYQTLSFLTFKVKPKPTQRSNKCVLQTNQVTVKLSKLSVTFKHKSVSPLHEEYIFKLPKGFPNVYTGQFYRA